MLRENVGFRSPSLRQLWARTPLAGPIRRKIDVTVWGFRAIRLFSESSCAGHATRSASPSSICSIVPKSGRRFTAKRCTNKELQHHANSKNRRDAIGRIVAGLLSRATMVPLLRAGLVSSLSFCKRNSDSHLRLCDGEVARVVGRDIDRRVPLEPDLVGHHRQRGRVRIHDRVAVNPKVLRWKVCDSIVGELRVATNRIPGAWLFGSSRSCMNCMLA